jgi:multicomponent Na+:H+ antiporter subunit B
VTSIIIQTASRALQPLLLFFSVFLLVRGHNHPGGGFVGGLVAAASFAMLAVAFGPGPARASLRIDPRTLVGAGLAIALAGAAIPLLLGRPLLTGAWLELTVGAEHLFLGTPFLFDLGVYLLVMGTTITIVFALSEE